MKEQTFKYGIQGYQAPELSIIIEWVDEYGKSRAPIQLSDYNGKFKVVYGFQSWCPGCHSIGLPALQKMVKALEGNKEVVFFAVQTVFEGRQDNTKEKILEIQKQYDLQIPFAHDIGDESTGNKSSIMYNYRTGGTPWFILIDQNNTVLFNDYHLNVEKAIEFLNSIVPFQKTK